MGTSEASKRENWSYSSTRGEDLRGETKEKGPGGGCPATEACPKTREIFRITVEGHTGHKSFKEWKAQAPADSTQ